MVEAEVDLTITYWSAKSDRRIFKRVKLERAKINFFSTSWTVVRPIDEDSIIYGWNDEDFDDSYARQVYDRMSYTAEEVRWGRKFEPIFDQDNDGMIHIDLDRLNANKESPLN